MQCEMALGSRVSRGRAGRPTKRQARGWPGRSCRRCICRRGGAGRRRDYATLVARGLHEEPGRASLRAADRRGGCRACRCCGRRAARLSGIRCWRCSRRPNPRSRRRELLETVLRHLQTAGNAYVEAGRAGCRECRELLRAAARPGALGADGRWADGAGYADGSEDKRILPSGRRRPGGALHLSLFHPLDDHRGLAAGGGGAKPRYPQRGGALEQGAARQRGAAVRGAGLCAGAAAT